MNECVNDINADRVKSGGKSCQRGAVENDNNQSSVTVQELVGPNRL